MIVGQTEIPGRTFKRYIVMDGVSFICLSLCFLKMGYQMGCEEQEELVLSFGLLLDPLSAVEHIVQQVCKSQHRIEDL